MAVVPVTGPVHGNFIDHQTAPTMTKFRFQLIESGCAGDPLLEFFFTNAIDCFKCLDGYSELRYVTTPEMVYVCITAFKNGHPEQLLFMNITKQW